MVYGFEKKPFGAIFLFHGIFFATSTTSKVLIKGIFISIDMESKYSYISGGIPGSQNPIFGYSESAKNGLKAS